MNFPAKNRKIARVKVHQKTAQGCYAASLRVPLRYKLEKKEVNMVAGNCELDPKPNDEPRVETKDETLPWQLGGPG